MAERMAVLIANEDYSKTEYRNLNFCKQDMEYMEKLLKFHGYQVESIIDADDIEEESETAIEKLTEKGKKKPKLFHFHFSGHGIHNNRPKLTQNKSGEILTHDLIGDSLIGCTGDPEFRFFAISLLKERLLRNENLGKDCRITATLDACRNPLQGGRNIALDKRNQSLVLETLPLDQEEHLRIFVFSSTLEYQTARDGDGTFTQRLCSLMEKKRGKYSNILEIEGDLNAEESEKIQGLKAQLCKSDKVENGDNWRKFFFPVGTLTNQPSIEKSPLAEFLQDISLEKYFPKLDLNDIDLEYLEDDYAEGKLEQLAQTLERYGGVTAGHQRKIIKALGKNNTQEKEMIKRAEESESQVDLKCSGDYTKLVQLHSTKSLNTKARVNCHVDGSIVQLEPILKCLTKANQLAIIGKIELTDNDCLLLEKLDSTTQLTIEASISFEVDEDNSIQSLSPLLHILTKTNQLVITGKMELTGNDGLLLEKIHSTTNLTYSLEYLYLDCDVSNVQEEWVAQLIAAVPVVGLEPGFKLTDNICEAVSRRMAQGGTQLQGLVLYCDLVNVRDVQFSCLVASVSRVGLLTKVSQSQALGLANRLEGQGGKLVKLELGYNIDLSSISGDTLAIIVASVNQVGTSPAISMTKKQVKKMIRGLEDRGHQVDQGDLTLIGDNIKLYISKKSNTVTLKSG